jgi:hypothetical protein
MDKAPATISKLRKAAEVTDQEIDAAVVAAIDAVLAGLPSDASPHIESETFTLGEQPLAELLMAETLKVHERAWKRNMVRTAILLAHPVRG